MRNRAGAGPIHGLGRGRNCGRSTRFEAFWGRVKAGLLLAMLVLPMMLSAWVRADVGLMLNEALGDGASRWTGAGHASIYLSNICAASPVTVRALRAGRKRRSTDELSEFGEDRRYRWNAIPLNIYLYGVEDERERPCTPRQPCAGFWKSDTGKSTWARLHGGVPDESERTMARRRGGHLRTGHLRFVAKTTAEQDKKPAGQVAERTERRTFNGADEQLRGFCRRHV